MTRTIGLVACCGKKLDHPAPARELYQSALFKLSRAYVERHCPDGWAILSAKHGLVLPRQIVQPYDRSLAHLSQEARMSWAHRTNRELVARFPGARFVVLAGERYLLALCAPLGKPLVYEAPLAGLGIGERLAWLKARVEG
jgi:hypothetical protein